MQHSSFITKTPLSSAKLPIVHRRQDCSQSALAWEIRGFVTPVTVTLSEPHNRFENALFSMLIPGSCTDSSECLITEPGASVRVSQSEIKSMSLALSPGPELLPYVGGLEIKNGASPQIIATFSRHTCFPMFIGMTADRCDILVSLSPNLKRFFSHIFGRRNARSFEVNRSRYCMKVSDPIIILAHPVSMIPSPMARSRSILCFFAFSSNEQRCSRRLRHPVHREQCVALEETQRTRFMLWAPVTEMSISLSFLGKKLVFFLAE